MTTIETGLILPVNYSLWPEKSGAAIMALVVARETGGKAGDMLSVCLVHNEVRQAGFFDLIVPAHKISLGCNLVIMSESRQVISENALVADVSGQQSGEHIKKCFSLPAAERENILKDLDYLQKNTRPEVAFEVLRGEFFAHNSQAAAHNRRLLRNWSQFRLAALNARVESCKRHLPLDFEVENLVSSIRLSLNELADTAVSLFPGPFDQFPANEDLALAASLSTHGRANHAANLKSFADVQKLRHLLKDRLELYCQKINLNEHERNRLEALLNGNTADLLELALRIARR